MLNMQSSYFRDQLIEKLQLMLATQEVTIGVTHRYTKDDKTYDHSVDFILNDTKYNIFYNSADPKWSLPVALQQLADTLIEKMHSYLKTRLALEAV